MARQFAPGTRLWQQQDDIVLPPVEVQAWYERGYAGVWKDEEQRQRFVESVEERGGYGEAADAVSRGGIAGSGEGRLSLAFLPMLDIWPTCYPGPAQARGDCVSHSSKNAALATYAAEVLSGRADEVSGRPDGTFEISETGIANGVFSSEANYWWRDHGDDGWSCDHSARVMLEESGLWIRKDYTDTFGFDLTEYSGRLAGKWGRQSPPSEIKEFGREHLIRTATVARNESELRDLIGNYYCVSSCGSEGFSNQRDSNGVSKRRGNWAHAMSYIGFDDRASTKREYGGPLVLVMNSWGKWNSGPRDVHDSASMVPAAKKNEWIRKGIVNAETGNIMIPHGSFWARWSDISRRYMIAFSSIDGWPPQTLDYSGSLAG